MTDQPASLDAFMAFLDDDGFDTPPIASRDYPEGKVYHVPSPDGVTGSRLSALGTLAVKANAKVKVDERDIKRLRLDDNEERDVMAQALGTAYDEMMADGVTWQRITRLGQYAFVYFTSSPQAADEAAAAGVFSGHPKALNRSQRREQERNAGKAPATGTGSTATKKPRSKKA